MSRWWAGLAGISFRLYAIPFTHLYAAAASILGPKVQGTEPSNIVRVVEHPANHSLIFVDLYREARQHHFLQHYAVWIAAAEGSCALPFITTRVCCMQ